MDEYRRRICLPIKPLRFHRYWAMCCAAFAASDDSGVVDIYEFDEELDDFSKTKTIKFQMKIEKLIYARGKIFAFGKQLNVSEWTQKIKEIDLCR